jgi:hypothetical protein
MHKITTILTINDTYKSESFSNNREVILFPNGELSMLAKSRYDFFNFYDLPALGAQYCFIASLGVSKSMSLR